MKHTQEKKVYTNQEVILQALKEHSSFYLYDERIILDRIAELQTAFSKIDFLYSMKTNHLEKIVSTIIHQGIGVDAASFKEAELAYKLGVSKEKIQYSAPAKSDLDIENALEIATLIADSLNEIEKIQIIAASKNKIVHIGVRINPDFTFNSEKGIPSKFGIDAELFFDTTVFEKINSYKNIRINGLHIHSKSQELNSDKIKAYYKNVFNFAVHFQTHIQTPLDFINFGSGIGITYHLQDTPLNIHELGTCMNALIKEFTPQFPRTKFYIETGRYLVGESGTYITKIMDKKLSRDELFILLHNTLNGFIRSSIDFLVNTLDSQLQNLEYEPLYTKKDAIQLYPLKMQKTEQATHTTQTAHSIQVAHSPKSKVDTHDTNATNIYNQIKAINFVGNLCTSTDSIKRITLSDDRLSGENSLIKLSSLEIDDAILIPNAGSYAWVLSPMQFSSQTLPAQLFLTASGELLSIH